MSNNYHTIYHGIPCKDASALNKIKPQFSQTSNTVRISTGRGTFWAQFLLVLKNVFEIFLLTAIAHHHTEPLPTLFKVCMTECPAFS